MRSYPMKPQYRTFGEFVIAKRKEKELAASRVCEMVGISPSYYCDIERGRRNPPDKYALARLASVLGLCGDDEGIFYDLAGQARSEAPPDLPDYINDNHVVRVALRLAKSRGNADDWRNFIISLQGRAAQGG